jgi:hypothetical protein
MAMTKVGGLLYGAAAVVLLMLCSGDVGQALLWLHDYSSSTGMFALGVAAVVFATFGPLAWSLCCWGMARRVQHRWAVHLLSISGAYAVVHVGALLLDFADGRPWSDEPAGYALVGAFLLFGLTVLVHAAALLFEFVAAVRRRRVDLG